MISFDHDPSKIQMKGGALRAVVSIPAGEWVGTLDGYLAGNRPECEVLLSSSMVFQLRARPTIVYRENGLYHWPLLSTWTGLVPGIPPTVGILNQLDVVTLRPLKKGDPLCYDPATVIPEGHLGPELDGSPRYYNALTPEERAALRPWTPWSIRREFGDETPPAVTILCFDSVEARTTEARIGSILEDSGLSLEYMAIYPGFSDRYATNASTRLKALNAELRGKPAALVGGATVRLMGGQGRAYFTWFSGPDNDLRARLPDVADPAWGEEPFRRSLRDFLTTPPALFGTQGGTRFSRITTRQLPRPEGIN